MKQLFILFFLMSSCILVYGNSLEDNIMWAKYYIQKALDAEKTNQFEVDEPTDQFVSKEWTFRDGEDLFIKSLYKEKSFDDVYKLLRTTFCDGFLSELPEVLPNKTTMEEQIFFFYYKDMLVISVCDTYYLFKKTQDGFIESISYYTM